MGHVDRSELDPHRPLVSVSCVCLLLLPFPNLFLRFCADHSLIYLHSLGLSGESASHVVDRNQERMLRRLLIDDRLFPLSTTPPQSHLRHRLPISDLVIAAVFLLGGETRDIPPTPILLQSGDVIVLSGPVRRAYHG